MARLPDAVIQTIKAEVSLLRLVESQGYQLQQQGKDYALCCPFHDDKEPSCIITPKSNLFNCFGCGAGGSVIDWVMKTQGVSFRHAVEILRDGPSSLAADNVVKKTTVPKLDAPISESANDQVVLQEVIEYYHHTLKQSPEALEYLEKRGLNDPGLIDQFKLGYANRTLGLRLPQKNRKTGAALREQLQAVGIYRDTGREHFNGSLVIPVINNNTVKEIYGRKLLNNLRVGTPKHTYLPGPHDGVFNLEGLRNTEGRSQHPASHGTGTSLCGEVILCESLIDALTFWRWGFKHVTSSYGVNGFTEALQQALMDNNIKRVLIAYDRDDAGNKAAENVASQLTQQGIDCFRVLFPKGMDANEYALKTQPTQKALALVIRKAEWLGKGKGKSTADSLQPTVETTAKERFEAELKTLAKQVKAIDEKPSSISSEPVDTTATPMPAMPTTNIEVKQNNNELFIDLGDRTYRIRGLDKNTDGDQLKIQLLVKKGDTFHMDKLDLYSSKQRQVFINQACVELGVKDEIIKKDLGKVLLALEEHQASTQTADSQPLTVELEPEARKAALSLLTDSELLNRILTDFNQAGVVGEETNKLAGYLSCVSRKLEKPLAVIIQSSSAAGKSSLMDSILALMPEEERVHYSAMTGQSLFYMGETNLKNKILAISEEEGASNASYALKLLQSEGEVTIASTGKDESTGNLVTKEYTVQGPVMLFLTTTAIDIDEELLNRCVVLTVNESREQTQAIHAAQRARRTLQGLHKQLEKERIIQLHRDAQRLIKPLYVINPYADQLTFLDDKTRTRRDHEKYLTLIDSIALLHQYQREIKTLHHNGELIEYVEVTIADIAVANQLAHDILGRTLDELPPQTRKLLKEIQVYVQRECQTQKIAQCDFRFSRKAIRQLTSWGNTQLKVHLRRLEEMEYLLVHRGGRGQSFEYELLYDADGDNQPHLMGLIDVDALQNYGYDQKKSGVNENKSGPSRPQVGGVSGQETWLNARPAVAYRESGSVLEKNALGAV